MDPVRDARPFEAIPRARRVRLFGSVPSLLMGGYEFLKRTHDECGDLFVVDLGVNEVVVAASPEAAEVIFVTESKNYGKRGEFWEAARDAGGNGLAMSEGELWRRQRRLMNPAFRQARIAGLRRVVEEVTRAKLAELRESADNGDLDISSWTAGLLSALTGRLLIGSSLRGEQFDRFKRALQVLTSSITASLVTRRLPSWVMRSSTKRFKEAKRFLNDTVLQLIEQRRRSAVDHDDLLGMLLAATDGDGAMSDEQLRDEVIISYVAGFETTAWGLAWGMALLARQPAERQALQQSLEQHPDPMKNPLLRAHFMEMLRLYPSAPSIPRVAIDDAVLDGYTIPAGTTVAVLPWLVHRNPRVWPESNRFLPERHLQGDDRHRLAWMPFGAGQRLCIGKGLAMMEAQIILDAVLRELTPLEPLRRRTKEPKRFAATLSAPGGVWIRLERRASATPAREALSPMGTKRAS